MGFVDVPHATDRRGNDTDRREHRAIRTIEAWVPSIASATEHLVITFSGRDERTNRERPPAVPIAELLDVVRNRQATGSLMRDPEEYRA